MFEDVDQMEREIETFRKNVVASSELVEGIVQLTDASKKQQESFAAASSDLIKKVDSCIEQIKEDHEAALRTLSSDNAASISTLQQNLASEQSARIADLERIKEDMAALQKAYVEQLRQTIKAIASYQSESANKADDQIRHLSAECEGLIAQLKTELNAQQASYSKMLQQMEQTIRAYQDSAEKTYSDFVRRLETTNVDQLFKEIQDLKQSVQTKFLLVIGGIGVAVIVTVLGLILK